MDRMAEILNDMDLALEGVPFSENNKNIQYGIALLEHKNPSFSYSTDNLSLNDKVNELRVYYLNNGYTSNNEILNEISSYQMSVLK